ncbi:hypothetical protein Thimo_0207 [Thioflavicoccus mobilis 8321]|uniref:DUF7939 domain-containing protein n=1 Tax=Thioflavicoccus mobilis 8321 TaxID=765912 RepID=L0GUV0_9GAMM|nr:BatD family protein [Thioflavicoccus mobilis]AGA89079.1 hypothetical protein Thimo_0207 [Thioflavicoccus mobilis 8321]
MMRARRISGSSRHPGERVDNGRPGRRLLPLLLLCALLGGFASVPAAELQAWLSQQTTSQDRPVDLTLQLTGPGASSEPGALDLSGLAADFRILDRRTSTSVSIVDGVRNERYQLILRLLPTRTGELRIPPIPFGDQASEPLQLTVTEGSSGAQPSGPGRRAEPPIRARPDTVPANASVEAEVSPGEVRVGQQALLTARVTSQGALLAARLADPQPDDVEVLPLGEEITGGVYERRYALFPQRAGPLEIPPLVFEAQVPGASEALRAASEALTLDVQPRPAAMDDGAWLPARALRLSEAGSSGDRTVAVDEALERIITITADGLPASALPELTVAVPFELQVRRAPPQLWDERTPQGIIGHRRERIDLTAPSPGRYRLPELRLPWWDTTRDAARVATLPPRTLVVGSAAAAESAINAQGASADEPPRRPKAAAEERGPWIVPGLAILVYLLYLATRRSRPQEQAATTEPNPPRDRRAEAIAAVRAAYAASDAAAARDALLAWSRLRWPDDPPGNLARLVLRCPEPLRGQIALLEKAFFSPQPIPWDREPVWKGLEKESG